MGSKEERCEGWQGGVDRVTGEFESNYKIIYVEIK